MDPAAAGVNAEGQDMGDGERDGGVGTRAADAEGGVGDPGLPEEVVSVEPAVSAPPPEGLGQVFARLGPAAPMAIAAALLPALGGFVLLGTVGVTGPWLRDLGVVGLLLYAGVFALTSGLALLPTYAQSFLGGWAFGLAQGTPAALLGFALGSVIGYEVSRPVAAKRVTALIESKPTWRLVRDAFLRGSGEADRPGFWRLLGLVILVRLPPSSPFALTNMLMASVGVPRVIFVVGTLIGMAPRTALVVWLGSQLSGVSLTGESVKAAQPAWFWVANIAGAVLIALLFNHIAQRALRRATGG